MTPDSLERAIKRKKILFGLAFFGQLGFILYALPLWLFASVLGTTAMAAVLMAHQNTNIQAHMLAYVPIPITVFSLIHLTFQSSPALFLIVFILMLVWASVLTIYEAKLSLFRVSVSHNDLNDLFHYYRKEALKRHPSSTDLFTLDIRPVDHRFAPILTPGVDKTLDIIWSRQIIEQFRPHFHWMSLPEGMNLIQLQAPIAHSAHERLEILNDT